MASSIQSIDIRSMSRTRSSVSTSTMMWLLPLLLIAVPSGYGQSTFSECGQCTKKYQAGGLVWFDCFRVPGIPSISYSGCSLAEMDVLTIAESSGLSQLRDNDLTVHTFIKKVTITRSNLAAIDQGAFRGLKQLDYLDLSNNQLASLNFGLFSDNKALREIHLQGNKLGLLDGSINLPRLQILDLSSNKLADLRPDLFVQADSLKQLDLKKNHLQFIPVDVLSPLSSLQTLTVEGNPWACDCRNRDTFHLLSTESRLNSALDDFVCTYPSVYNRTSWRNMNLNEGHFTCHKILRIVTVVRDGNQEEFEERIINAPRGHDVMIGCEIEADPDKPGYSWRWKNGKDIKPSQDKYYTTTSPLNYTSHRFWHNLTVMNVSPEDSETYECHIVDDPKTASSQFVLLKIAGGAAGLGDVKTGKVWLWVVVGVLALLVVTMVMIIFVVFVRPRFGRRVTAVPYDSKPSPVMSEKPREVTTTDSVSAPLLNMNMSTLSNAQSEVGQPRLHSTLANGSTTLPSPRVHLMRRAPTPDLYGPPRSAGMMHEPYQFAYASFDPRRRPLRPNGFTPIHPPDNRLNSRFGSMTSITSEPVPRVPAGLGYVTLPRRARNPSWSHNGMANGYPRTPLSPTGSLPPPMRTYRYPPFGPELQTVPDGVGPRRTADGGSNLSLNQVGLTSPVQTSMSRPPSRSGFITPNTPVTPSSARLYRPYGAPSNMGSGRASRSRTPIGNNMYEALPSSVFTFEPLPEDEGPQDYSGGQKVPPVVPPKPNRVSTIVEEGHVPDLESIKGTEV